MVSIESDAACEWYEEEAIATSDRNAGRLDNGNALFRAIPATRSEADVAKAIALVKKQRLYPLAKAANPPEQRFIDMAGQLLDGIVRYDFLAFAPPAHFRERMGIVESRGGDGAGARDTGQDRSLPDR
jgi:hypothetical protein